MVARSGGCTQRAPGRLPLPYPCNASLLGLKFRGLSEAVRAQRLTSGTVEKRAPLGRRWVQDSTILPLYPSISDTGVRGSLGG